MPFLLRVVTVVALTLASLVAAVPAALADSNAPRLLSAARTSPDSVTVASPVTLSWAASDQDETGSGVRMAHFSYARYADNGEMLAWFVVAGDHLPGPDGRSLAAFTLNPWSAEGTYRLRRVDVWDQIGNTTSYWRDGSVTAHPDVQAPAPSGVDFASLDFEVLNPLGDTAVPVVDDLRLETRSVVAGEPLILRSAPSDDVSGVAAIAVGYHGPSGTTRIGASAEGALAPAGLLSGVVPFGAEGGLWRAASLYVEDRAGNVAHYRRDDGAATFRPDGVRHHQPQAPIDFASLDVEVVPRQPDAEAPTLDGLVREGPAQLRRGDDVVFRFDAQDANKVRAVMFDFQDSTDHVFTVANFCAPEQGVAVRPVLDGLDDGPVRLLFASVWDSLGNVRQYRRDGTVWTQDRLEPDPLPGYDLSAMDFEIVQGAPTYEAPVVLRTDCADLAQVPLQLPASADPGQTIPIAGEVRNRVDAPLPEAKVAVFATPLDQPPTLVDLVTTDAQGHYAVSHVIGDRDTDYRAQFLGRDGAGGAEPTTGQPHLVRVDGEPASDPPPEPEPTGGTGTVLRLAGADRHATAITVSQAGWGQGQAQAVVLSRSDDYADALAGTPLTAAVHGPLLTTATSGLDDRVLDEIRRVLPAGRTVYLLGGERALSPAVAQALSAHGYEVVRLAGSDRYATAVLIAEHTTPAPQRVLLATGRSFADALGAGTAAASGGAVVVLTDGSRLPAATAEYLRRQPVPRIAVGGPAAAAVPDAEAVVGRDRYETAALLARRFPTGGSTVSVATGASFPDALAGGAHAARVGAPLLLTPRASLPTAVADLVSATAPRTVVVYGGPAAVDDVVLSRLQQLTG